jgi:hypothetical protein
MKSEGSTNSCAANCARGITVRGRSARTLGGLTAALRDRYSDSLGVYVQPNKSCILGHAGSFHHVALRFWCRSSKRNPRLGELEPVVQY